MIIRRASRARVLFVIDDMGVGGAQKQVAAAASGLDAAGVSVGIVCLERGGVNLDRLQGAREVHVLGAPRVFDHNGLRAAATLARIIRSGRWDVVEAYLPAAHFISGLACSAGRARLLAARRNLADLDPRWYAAAAAYLNRATAFSITNSQTVKESIVRRYAASPSKIAVVPNIIEPPAAGVSRVEARRRLSIPENAFVAAAVGTIGRVKNYPALVRAFAALLPAVPNALLVIAGDGPRRRAVTALGRSLGLDGRLRMLGMTREVDAVLAAADVFIHASTSEGSSNALLEAMAAGLPAVVSDIPANREALGESGRYFAPDDWRGCLEGILEYATNPGAAACDGARGRRRIEKRFNPARSISRRMRIYNTLLEASR